MVTGQSDVMRIPSRREHLKVQATGAASVKRQVSRVADPGKPSLGSGHLAWPYLASVLRLRPLSCALPLLPQPSFNIHSRRTRRDHHTAPANRRERMAKRAIVPTYVQRPIAAAVAFAVAAF